MIIKAILLKLCKFPKKYTFYLVKYIKGFQPKEIHLISASPPVAFPCHYGVDFPDIEELIINKIPEKDMPSYFGVKSVTYLQVANLHKTVLPIINLQWNQCANLDTDLDTNLNMDSDKEIDKDLKKNLNKNTKNINVNDIQHNMCSACFDGNYPF